MRGADTRSRKHRSPDVVTTSVEIKVNSGEPGQALRASDLFTNDDRRPDGVDEPMELGPEVALVLDAEALPGDAERLAGTGTAPPPIVVGKPGEPPGKSPPADAGEEMTGVESSEVHRSNIDN